MLNTKIKLNKVKVWVHPEFKKYLKEEAARAEISMVALTKDFVVNKKNNTQKKDGDFKFFI